MNALIPSLIRPLVPAMFGDSAFVSAPVTPSTTTRHFAQFDPLAQSYIELSDPVTLSEDFESSVDFSTANPSDMIILGNLSNTENFIYIRSDGGIRVRINNNSIDSAAGIVQADILNTVRVVRARNSIEVYFNGAFIASGIEAGDWVLDAVGRYSGGFNFDGHIANVKITDFTRPVSDQLVIDMPIDGNYSPDENVVENNVADLGGELSGVFVNVAQGDSELFTFNINDKEWIGSNNLFIPSGSVSWDFDGVSAYTKNINNWGRLGEAPGFDTVKPGNYIVSYTMLNEIGDMRAFTRNQDNTSNMVFSLAEGQNVQLKINVPYDAIWFDSNNSNGTTLSDISIFKVLEVA